MAKIGVVKTTLAKLRDMVDRMSMESDDEEMFVEGVLVDPETLKPV